MRSFLRFLLGFIFVLSFPLVLFGAMPRLNGFTIERLKHNLVEQQSYDLASAVIQTKLAANPSEDSSSDTIGAIIKDQLSPSYLQLKVETLLDQTSAWAQDTSKPEPSLSFNDLQEKLNQQNPELKGQIDQALQDLKEQANNGGQLPQVAEDQESQQQLQKLLEQTQNLDKLASGDWTLSLAKPLASLPKAYTYYTYGLPIATAILILLLVGIFALGTSMPGRMRSLGKVLVITAIWNAILSFIWWFVALQDTVLRSLPLAEQEKAAVEAFAHAIQTAVFYHYLTIQGIATAILLVAGIVLLFLGRAKHVAPVEEAAKPEPPAPSVDLVEKPGHDDKAAKPKSKSKN